jgi:hypothetical protein
MEYLDLLSNYKPLKRDILLISWLEMQHFLHHICHFFWKYVKQIERHYNFVKSA